MPFLRHLACAAAVVALSAAATGCGSVQDPIRAVSSDYPAEKVAVLHCNWQCRKIYSGDGELVAEKTGAFSSAEIGTVELAEGDYTIEFLKCYSFEVLLSDDHGRKVVSLAGGREYRAAEVDVTEPGSKWVCYDLEIDDTAAAAADEQRQEDPSPD